MKFISQKLRSPHFLVIREVFRILWSYPWWFVAAIASTIIVVGVEPSFALVGKNFLDGLKKDKIDIDSSLLSYGLLFARMILGRGLLKFGDKMIDKIYELKLIIRLQRFYLESRDRDRGTEDISRVIFDCERAKAGLDIVYKDASNIIFQTISVVIWQLAIAPKWLPILLITVIPPTFFGFAFGGKIQRTSLNRLQAQQNIAASTGLAQQQELHEHQHTFMGQTIRMEVYKFLTETIMDLLTWIGLLLLVLTNSVFKMDFLPQQIEAGELLLFIANLNSLSKPLGSIVKVNNKAREAYPALLRILMPDLATRAAPVKV
jgi:ABC-type multidrug transport system fused ATPase/permease subunit